MPPDRSIANSVPSQSRSVAFGCFPSRSSAVVSVKVSVVNQASFMASANFQVSPWGCSSIHVGRKARVVTKRTEKVLELLQHNGPRIHRLLTRLTLSEDVAADLMQDLFLKLRSSDGFACAEATPHTSND